MNYWLIEFCEVPRGAEDCGKLSSRMLAQTPEPKPPDLISILKAHQAVFQPTSPAPLLVTEIISSTPAPSLLSRLKNATELDGSRFWDVPIEIATAA